MGDDFYALVTSYVVGLWLAAHGLEVVDEALQATTLFAITITGDALTDVLGNFSRELLVKSMVHMVDSAPPISAYPRLTLEPGGRSASKGCDVVPLAALSGEPAASAPDWVVP